MENSTKSRLIILLNKVINEDLRGVCTYFGLCRYLNDNIKGLNAYDFIERNCRDWEEFTGDSSYPIRGYFKNNNKWVGKQLELRQSLSSHLRSKLEDNTYV